MKIQIKRVKELDIKTYKRLYCLNDIRGGGAMRPTLVAFRNDNQRHWRDKYGNLYRISGSPSAYSIYIKNSCGTIVSWVLLYSYNSDSWYTMIFTSTKHRRKGYGKIVLNSTFEFSKKKLRSEPCYFPCDSSVEFFDRVIPDVHKNGGMVYRYI